MKRPFFTTVKGQRLSMNLSYIISLFLLVALGLQINLVENPRNVVTQLDSGNLSSCELLECGRISQLGGLEPIRVAFEPGEFHTTVRVEFVNHGRLQGSRDLRLELRNSSGGFLEAATTRVLLMPKGRTKAEFGFTHSVPALESGRLKLSY